MLLDVCCSLHIDIDSLPAQRDKCVKAALAFIAEGRPVAVGELSLKLRATVLS